MPVVKLREFRKTQAVRDRASETRLLAQDLILPYFAAEGVKRKRPISSMPGVFHFSVDALLEDIRQLRQGGITRVLLFGIPLSKDQAGAWRRDGIVQKAVRAIKNRFRDVTVMTDVCLCAYTTHGHCGVVRGRTVVNDQTVELLAKTALSHAEAGADIVAPSAMMDGQVKAIRGTLDKHSFKTVKILAYSAKYSSNFYGPFREALDSAPQFGDRKTYQMDYRNSDEALREIREDIKEGADMVMVKPALSYLDIIWRAKQVCKVPVVAYNVSGEYAMVKAYCNNLKTHTLRGTGDSRLKTERNLALEMLTGIKRAGADFIITYWAKDAARWLGH